MTTTSFFRHLLMIITAIIPLVYIIITWEHIPATIPLHFDISGKPDSFGSKSMIWLGSGILSGVSILVYFLLNNLHKIDPKRAAKQNPLLFGKIAVAMVFFLAALNFIIILSETGNGNIMERGLMPFLGLMFAFLGNVMIHIKPNYFFGIRVPWTLNSDDNWRKTHQLGGKLWFAGGLLIVLLSFFFSPVDMNHVMMALVAMMVIIPVAYSFLLFKKEQKLHQDVESH